MSFLVIFGISLFALFLVAYMTKRRFGVLGLALVTGAYVSSVWVGQVTPLVAEAGISTIQPPLESLVSAALILLPASVLLMSGPVYRNKTQRFVGALLFMALSCVLLLDAFGSALVIEGAGLAVYEFLVEYRIFIVTACIVIALLDILGIKTPKINGKH